GETTAPPAAAPKATVGTLGKAANGNGIAFSAGTLFAASGTGVQSAGVSALTGTVTFAADNAVAARAVTFDGTAKYLLTATAIVKAGGATTTLTGVTDPTDFAVSGTTAYVVSKSAHVIYKVDLGTGTATVLAGTEGNADYHEGTGAAAAFNGP